jgi:pimeloyl-ACP methyl ester carboxylesterase
VPTTANGSVELFYETFGASDPEHPTLLLVNGLGSQCINFKDAFCERFAARGFRVVRFDNRDVGLSSHLVDGPDYTVEDMAADAFAVLDAVGAAQAHVAGWSMGGMIVQTMAILRPDRLLSVTSVMSSPGGGPLNRDEEVMAQFSAPPETNRAEAIARHLAGLQLWGSPAAWDVDRITADAEAAFDRCFDPAGRTRQVQAIMRSGSRVEALGGVRVPFLVVHGDKDRLVDPAEGSRTADAVPGARFELVEGMGHDYPPQVWDTMVDLIASHATAAASATS